MKGLLMKCASMAYSETWKQWMNNEWVNGYVADMALRQRASLRQYQKSWVSRKYSLAIFIYIWMSLKIYMRSPTLQADSLPSEPPGKPKDIYEKFVCQFSCVWFFATPWTAECKASLSITNSRSLLKLMSIESVMPFNHLILCHPLFLLSSIFPRIRVFSNESLLHIRWPK